ncbi:uracil-DNA glycosylase [Paenibacillus sp. N5-1-1-5]|uniref:Uracil-DNA glycosylase n=1 Tax=Paenibacillus radicis (ex Xue et al. 2023) TaxID=2972489 RepID=A0ABT1YM76_9BACL|nr:uracil-DNA glycosylase [Paenibacillus radicis (ex Xue et al. 2023)]
MTNTQRINCMKCQHFYVTWDPKFPKGCKAFGFKSHNMPSLTVLSSSGKTCMNFEPKPAPKA